jgi:hypothetical protein
MAIWLNDFDTAASPTKAAPETAGRQRLQQTLERLHAARQQSQGPDCALVMIDVRTRPEMDGNAEEAQHLLHQALQHSGRTPFALRNGQFGLLMAVRGSLVELQVLVTSLKQALQQAAANRYQLLFGAAMASETKLGASGWLAMADLRLQTRQGRLGLQAGTPRSEQERRRYAASSSLAAQPRAIH